ncbi:siderophore-interacting protein [Nocardia sp. NPDC051832]|uniref:siderophore-interacting protein n=1 Tax=Nocardia sp. NPDC051832 TaxID=3155673 RepID=UPI003449CFC3
MGRGLNGVMIKAWRGQDYRLTVRSHEVVTDHYVRLGFDANGLLADHPEYPTQYVRVWIPESGSDKLHHRAFTLIDQDAEADQFFIEFALHHGPAADWARTASPGDQLEVTALEYDAKKRLPATVPSEYLMFGDTASLPAINALLESIGDTPARVWLEWQNESDKTLPVRNKPHHEVTWVQRIDDGRLMREQAQEITCADGAFAWIACCGQTTRSLVKTFKTTHALPKTALQYQAYWK